MKSSVYLYRRSFENKLIDKIAKKDFGPYHRWLFGATAADLIMVDLNINVDFNLEAPDKNGKHDLENCIKVYENMKSLTPSEAVDGRLWSYLSHEKFYGYSIKRWPHNFDNSSKDFLENVLRHYILKGTSIRGYLDNSIARLWWMAYLTYDEELEDPYQLTKELLSDLDYTRTLITGLLGRNKIFLHAFLKFAASNEWLSIHKEDKVRELMKRMNFLASYKIFGILSESEIISLLEAESEKMRVKE